MSTASRSRIAASLALVLLVCCSGRRLPATYEEPSTGIRFVLIPAGRFEMGSPPDAPGHRPDELLHPVVITRPFYLSATEVTQRQWRTVMGTNPSHFQAAGPSAPVEQVTWLEVQEFLRRLNERGEGRFRLPTEAEWEYSCRATTRTNFSTGTQLTTDAANFDGRDSVAGQPKGTYRGQTMPVGSFAPNAWGLYDMHGNVWEWCADEYCPYPAGAVVDPWQRCGSGLVVIRGGSWYFGADSARSALRYTHAPHLRGFSIGFRVVRETGT